MTSSKPKKKTTKAVAKKSKTAAKAPAKKKAVARKPAKKASVKKKAVAKPAKKAVAKKPVKKAVAKKPVKKVVKEAKKKPAVKSEEANAKTEEKRPGKKARILSRAFLEELAHTIKEAVAPLTQAAKGREVVGQATSGDATFEIDRIAEKALLTFLKNARLPVAYYSEDSGYTTFTNAQPQNLLIIDPIDGTRAAKSGFEACTVSIASTRVIERPTMADVDNACVDEILGDRTFYAERGKGIRISQDGHFRRAKLSTNTDLEMVAWSMTVPARPAELIFPAAARLIDLTSLKGGFFACNSTSFSLTRLVTNQLDACVDVANRFLRDIPELVHDQFINAGRGVVMGIAPYDIAGALLIAQEAGCIVTDAYGGSFDDVLLLDTGVENQRSMIAAANANLHAKILTYFEMRIQQWEELLRRRAERNAK